MIKPVILATCLALAGCAAPSGPAAREAVLLAPPAEYLEPCDVPTLPEDARNRDLARAFQDAVASLRECNIDKEALRTWRDAALSPAEPV